MSPTDTLEGERTRAGSRVRILEAARALFAERGFWACRVADVARAAGMSAGNVYWLFDSKEAILREILAEGFGNVEAMTAEVADAYGPARRKLELLVDRTLALYDDNLAFMVIAASLAGEGGRELVRSLGFDMAAVAGRSQANLRRIFAEARTEGAVTLTDPELLGALFLGFFNGLVTTYRDLWPTLPRDALRDAALRLVGYRPVG